MILYVYVKNLNHIRVICVVSDVSVTLYVPTNLSAQGSCCC